MMSEGNSRDMAPLVAAVRERLRVTVTDDELLLRALSHRSAVPQEPGASYERLEFLGDSVVSLVVCEWLYLNFPDLPEGEMAKRRGYLVSEPVLAEAGRAVGIDDLVVLGPTAEASGDRRRASVRSDVLEAIVGAVFVDRGIRTARGLVRRLLKPALRRVSRGDFEADHKTRLQEMTQARWRALPVYAIGPPAGEPHCPTFTAVVSVGDRVLGAGHGASKRAAQQEAARVALGGLADEAAAGAAASRAGAEPEREGEVGEARPC
ncbi:MAG: ribonuclease III [Armatimonadetes bacterium]|nr:ribonuclease III [Armatimonadota bacterium]